MAPKNDFMRQIFLGTLLLFHIRGYAQEIQLDRQEINSLSDLEKEENYHTKDEIIDRLLKDKTDAEVIYLPGNQQQQMLHNEQYLHANHNNLYTIKYEMEESATVKKYSNGQLSQDKKVVISGVFYTLSEDGVILHIDAGHGGASTYTFYSSNLEITSEYKPYPHGIQEDQFDSNGRIIAILSKERVNSPKAKISVLDLAGRLISEKEIDASGFSISDIKIADNNIVVLLTKLGSIGSRVGYYDNNLNLRWERNFTTGVSRYRIIANKEVGSVVLNATGKIRCFSESGEMIWSIDPSVISGRMSHERLTVGGNFVFDNKYVGIAIGNVSGAFEVTDNRIYLIDMKTGQIVYTDEVRSSKTALDVLSGSSGFYVLSSDKVLRYAGAK